MATESEEQKIKEAMGLLGKRTSPAKTAAARANALKPRPNRKPKPLASIECTCDGEGLNHKAGCPRGRAIRYRQRKGLPLA